MATPMSTDEVHPHEQIRRTMAIMLRVFTLHPLDAYHPGRHIPLCDAVPILSSLNQSHGLTDDQVGELGYLLSNWDRIINDAVSAKQDMKKATEQLSAGNQIALNFEMAQSKRQYLEEQRRQVEVEQSKRQYLEEQRRQVDDAWCQVRYARPNDRMSGYANQIQKEMEANELQLEKLAESLHHERLMAPRYQQQLERAEESMEKAHREWKALEVLLGEINSSLVLEPLIAPQEI